MRGEQLSIPPNQLPNGGSSPHARGTETRAARSPDGGRFIPACAGNSQIRAAGRPRRPVHPRMRGEQYPFYPTNSPVTGSSPHARGTGADKPAGRWHGRFIPACAGNSGARGSQIGGGAVHPRMRGEQVGIDHLPSSAGGSSPHARGTGGAGSNHFTRHRFIPACAGNSSPIQ